MALVLNRASPAHIRPSARPCVSIHHVTKRQPPCRYITYPVDYGNLKPSHASTGFRPVFLSTDPRRYARANVDTTLSKRALSHDDWERLAEQRVQLTQSFIMNLRHTFKIGTGPDTSPHNLLGVVPYLLRVGGQRALLEKTPVILEIKARKLCAEKKDARYRPVYHSIKDQAHILYLLGRVELEREPEYRQLAWYMLLIAAGLGHLDAALLLHKLHQHDPRFTFDQEGRATIAKAALLKSDWRAVVAHCEYMLSGIDKHRRNRDADRRILESAMGALREAFDMTGPVGIQCSTRSRPNADQFDADTLETYDPPYKALLNIATNTQCHKLSPEKTTDYLKIAALHGALQYNDPEAAWLYVQHCIDDDTPFLGDWVACAEIAASNGNANACFELAKYYIKKDGWHPTLTTRILRDAHARDRERLKLSQTEEDFRVVTEDEKHNEVLKQRNDGLLQTSTGLTWMKAAAELHCDDGTKMLNRYALVSGLFRQNGFLQQGRDVLRQAQNRIQNLAMKQQQQKAVVLARLTDLDRNWDKRRVHELLTPDQIDQLLSPGLTQSQ